MLNTSGSFLVYVSSHSTNTLLEAFFLSKSVEDTLGLVRPAVRGEKAYHVGELDRVEIKLNQNENPYGLPAELRAEFAEILQAFPVNRYPSIFPDELVGTLSRHLEVDPRSLIIGHGSNELSHFLALCFIERGTTVVLPRPMFSLYGATVRLFGGHLVEVDCRDDFSFDTDEILRQIRKTSPGLTIIANPNNPTGALIEPEVVEEIIGESPGIVVIDEAYIEFAPNKTVARLINKYPNLIVLRTLSKAYGLAGLRVGYMIGHPDLMDEMKKARLPFMIGRHDELCAIAVLNKQQMVNQWITDILEQTAMLSDAMSNMDGLQVLPTTTNFFLFRHQTDTPGLASHLGASHVAIRKMSGYRELQPYLRVSAGTPPENQRFLEALKSAFEQEFQT